MTSIIGKQSMKYMSWISCYCILVVTGCLSQTLSSQDDMREVLLVGGISVPYLPVELKNYWRNGWNAGLAYGYSLPQGKAGTSAITLSAEYSRFAIDRPKILAESPGVITSAGAASVFTLMLNYRGTFSSLSKIIQPFFILGFGFLHAEQGGIVVAGSSGKLIEAEINNGFAWTAGLGLTIPINEMLAFFIQGRSLLGVLNPTKQFFPVNAGIRYRY